MTVRFGRLLCAPFSTPPPFVCYMSYLFTSESVSEGHPDKVADQISDAILDAFLEDDPNSRVAVETMVTQDRVFLAGEVYSKATVEVDPIVRDVIRDIGYTKKGIGFDADTCCIVDVIHEQSKDIREGVDRVGEEQGAGDQGMMFGYACRETPELLPLPLHLAHRLVRTLAEIRKRGREMSYLLPDSKSQVTVEYEDDGHTVRRIDTIVVSTQTEAWVSNDRIKRDIKNILIPRVIGQDLLNDDITYHVNPTGRFVKGGPAADAGLTGRKIIVDSYGGRGAHGGGAFSGKDPSKVDRSAAYAARHIAKNLIAADLADSVEVQIAYAIGVAEPVSIHVDSAGTGRVSDPELTQIVKDIFKLKPRDIIERLQLKRPVYRRTAAYGHFGRCEFTWEALDKVEALQNHPLARQSELQLV